MSEPDWSTVEVSRYHEGTKHHYHRFARSLGYLDWASQPRPFRSFRGTRLVSLFPAPGAERLAEVPSPAYDALFVPASDAAGGTTLPSTIPAIGFFLRHALGLSAWKGFRDTRWSLRVNPSSGNLHPTEAYVITGGAVWHYAPDRHALEERCRFDDGAWPLPLAAHAGSGSPFLVVLTSIHWREAWKYGERAFRYCQHDIGHAIAALRLSAALCGWRARLLDEWTHDELATASGTDRDQDYVDSEPEEPACVLLVTSDNPPPFGTTEVDRLVRAIRDGTWTGQASQLSEDHVQWSFIDEVATVTRRSRRDLVEDPATDGPLRAPALPDRPSLSWVCGPRDGVPTEGEPVPATKIILQRRSAVAFDGGTAMSHESFRRMLGRIMPGDAVPWDALWWPPCVHMLLFVHRVADLDPGLYVLPRTARGEALLRGAARRAFTWESADHELPLWRLASGDCRGLAQRVGCDQEIAADGCFSLGMLVDFEGGLSAHGPSFYRRLFWETGIIGQVLYLEAEAVGLRSTGIGCFYDDGVHDVLGIEDHALQSLYHFTVGGPVEDRRLTREPGYEWEAPA